MQPSRESESATVTPEFLLEQAAFLRAIARRILGDPSRAEDMVQEGLLRSLEQPAENRNHLRAWLVRVVRNLSLKAKRADSRRLHREKRMERKGPVPSPEELALHAETLRRVAQAVVTLDEPYRSAILLRFYRGLSSREMAKEHAIPLATVRSRVQRGISKLRDSLREQGGPEDWKAGLVLLAGYEPIVPASRWSETEPLRGTGAPLSKASLLIVAPAIVVGAALLVATVWPETDPPPDPASSSSSLGHQGEGTGRSQLGGFPEQPGRPEAQAGDASLARLPLEGPPPSIQAGEPGTTESDPQVASTASGIVVDREGRPVSDADIYAGSSASDLVLGTRSGDNGQFALGLPSDAVYLLARHEAHAPSHLYPVEAPDLNPQSLVIALRGPAAGLLLTVRDPTGQGVPGARVRVGPENYQEVFLAEGIATHSAPPLEMVTDGEGICHVGGLPPRESPIQVNTEPWAPARTFVSLAPGEQSVTEVRLAIGGAVEGVARSETGEGLPGVRVVAKCPEKTWWSGKSTVTAQDGSFVLDGLPAGTLDLSAVLSEGGEYTAVDRETLQASAGNPAHWDPVLDRSDGVRGRLLDPDGIPLAGWLVCVEPFPGMVRTRADGSFRITGSSGPLDVTVWGPGWQPNAPLLAAMDLVAGVDHVLRFDETSFPSAFLEGVITTTDGAPLDQARIILDHDGWPMGTLHDCEPETGRYRIGPLAPGSYDFQVRVPWIGGSGQPKRSVSLRSAEDLWLGESLIPPPGRLHFSVEPRDAEATQDLEFELVRDDIVVTSAGGDLPRLLALAPGSYELRLHGPNLPEARHAIEIVCDVDTHLSLKLASNPTRRFRIHLPESALPATRLSIAVQTSSGEPVSRLEVEVPGSGVVECSLYLPDRPQQTYEWTLVADTGWQSRLLMPGGPRSPGRVWDIRPQ